MGVVSCFSHKLIMISATLEYMKIYSKNKKKRKRVIKLKT
ncbi:hypothetical protein HNQ62_002865 [Sulfurisphaera ohwakuensis]|uniref:Uncharacterized protein n=1 Tax=Sulfurisphaera ohwakuensis TaxID=69656 RepID=A0A7J9RY97_SULOH|nr:hypothetical protein [Sulfurisphaera ohwakuensis]